MQGSKQYFGPRFKAKFGHVGPVKAPGSYSSESWGILRASWAIGAMLCQVEAICQVLFGHVVGFASRNALPQQDPDFKWVSASHVGSIWGHGYLAAMLALLAPFWDQLPPSRGP